MYVITAIGEGEQHMSVITYTNTCHYVYILYIEIFHFFVLLWN